MGAFFLLLVDAILINSITIPQANGRYYLAETFTYTDFSSSAWEYHKSSIRYNVFSFEKNEDGETFLCVQPSHHKRQIKRNLNNNFFFKKFLYFQFELKFPENEIENDHFSVQLVNINDQTVSPVLTLNFAIGNGKISAPLTIGLELYKCVMGNSKCTTQMIGTTKTTLDVVRLYPQQITLEISPKYLLISVDSKSALNITIADFTKTQSSLFELPTMTNVILDTPSFNGKDDPLKLDNMFLTDNRRALNNWTNQIDIFITESIYDFMLRLYYTDLFRFVKYIFWSTLPIVLMISYLIWRVCSLKLKSTDETEENTEDNTEESKIEETTPDSVRKR